MSADDSKRAEVAPGDRIQPGKPVVVDRYTKGARINHWITAGCLILLALSGLSMFHPSLFFLTALFGGGETTRAIHPWIGVLLFFSFAGLFWRFWPLNLWQRRDTQWVRQIQDVLTAKEDKVPEPGKYNAGQKFVFWAMSGLIIVLILTGISIWDQYFSHLTSIETQRVTVIIHASAAVAIICVWIIHVYAGIWVRGSIPAMIRGRVTGGWAWRHHRKWLRALAGREPGPETSGSTWRFEIKRPGDPADRKPPPGTSSAA